MKTVKPDVDIEAAAKTFKDCMGSEPQEIIPLSVGKIASTFQCVVHREPFIVQFNSANMSYGLFKERFFRYRLQAVGVPTREVFHDGEYQGLKYTISKKAPGNRLTSLPPAEFVAALPAVFDILVVLSWVNMEGTEGYGWFNESSISSDPSWQVHLSNIRKRRTGPVLWQLV